MATVSPLSFPKTRGSPMSSPGIPERVPFLSVVNGHEVEDPHPLHDGDELTIFPPLSGGRAR